ncbi:hypothetical protein KSP39_PZI011146 [Platanthera zijinensis]|uniref:Uncharacterized protein n=1 Tax=Platanthera zijinensis TaxID=2320716 RepID=A0AAP0BH91_9ASPA
MQRGSRNAGNRRPAGSGNDSGRELKWRNLERSGKCGGRRAKLGVEGLTRMNLGRRCRGLNNGRQ